jgi:hypothetical protein
MTSNENVQTHGECSLSENTEENHERCLGERPFPELVIIWETSQWEDNIKMDLREIGFGNVDWIHWAQDRDRWRALVNTAMNLRVP